jgi:hypothetical protein
MASRPIALTDTQLNAIMDAAEPLHPHDRTSFLEWVAERLNGRELGDGFVGRVVRETQREFWHPPEIDPRRYGARHR